MTIDVTLMRRLEDPGGAGVVHVYIYYTVVLISSVDSSVLYII